MMSEQRETSWVSNVRWEVAGPVVVETGIIGLSFLVPITRWQGALFELLLVASFAFLCLVTWSLPRWIAMWGLGPIYFGTRRLPFFNSLVALIWSIPWIVGAFDDELRWTPITFFTKLGLILALLVYGWSAELREESEPPIDAQYFFTRRGTVGFFAAMLTFFQVLFSYVFYASGGELYGALD